MVTTVRAADPLYVVGSQQQKTPGRTVIAHISDLHFTSVTDPDTEDVWDALRTDLGKHKVDLLVATGDLVDSSVRDNFHEKGVREAFVRARNFLLSLCEEGGIADPATGLRVVPGNHDFRIKGVFTPESRYDWVKRAKQWLLTPHFDLFYEHLGEYYKPVFLPNLRCCLFTFDSNAVESGLVLATGRVANSKIVEFTRLCDRIQREQAGTWESCTKIALLHHHPMPIGPTEREARRVEDESYLLLKNAGLFMSEMVRRKVDLILHGHKHYPALSRATFPRSEENAHTVSVVAAGSASADGHPHTSYNLITIHNNGTVSVDRMIREELSYTRGTSLHSLQAYEDTRRARFARLVREVPAGDPRGALIRVAKYTRVDTVKPDSGDDEMSERYEDVVSAFADNPPLARLPATYSSRSGSPGRPRLGSATHAVTWDPNTAQPGKGFVVFDPPIQNTPMSFTCEATIKNAIHFNKQDRLAITNSADDRESVRATIYDWYEMFTLKVRFPDDYDRRPTVQVIDEITRARDFVEEGYAARRFTSFKDDNTAVLILERPLPGYTYRIVWELPENEDEERNLLGADRQHIEEIRQRLLRLRSEEVVAAAAAVQESLAGLRAYFNAPPIAAAADLEIALHVHDAEAGGLLCAAVLDGPAAQVETLSRLIHVGDTAIGQAHKRREHVNWVRGQNRGDDSADFFDYDDERPHTGILSVPLFYPLSNGGKVMVVTLATRLRMAQMLRYLENPRSPEEIAGFKALVSKTHSWYASDLMAALGLPEIPVPAPEAYDDDGTAADPL